MILRSVSASVSMKSDLWETPPLFIRMSTWPKMFRASSALAGKESLSERSSCRMAGRWKEFRVSFYRRKRVKVGVVAISLPRRRNKAFVLASWHLDNSILSLSSSCLFLDAMMSLHPAMCKSKARARPMPELAPVSRTTCSSKSHHC